MEKYREHSCIDANEGLGRVANKKNLYAKLLNTFISNTRESELIEAINSKNLEKAAHAAHTIKGIAANLSLPRLRVYMSHLESKYKEAKEVGGRDAFEENDKALANEIIQETITQIKTTIESFNS